MFTGQAWNSQKTIDDNTHCACFRLRVCVCVWARSFVHLAFVFLPILRCHAAALPGILRNGMFAHFNRLCWAVAHTIGFRVNLIVWMPQIKAARWEALIVSRSSCCFIEIISRINEQKCNASPHLTKIKQFRSFLLSFIGRCTSDKGSPCTYIRFVDRNDRWLVHFSKYMPRFELNVTWKFPTLRN